MDSATASVVVTGASSGLGAAASAALAAAGRHVVLTCRDAERGAATAARIRERTPEASLDVLTMDLASLSSVRSAADELIEDADRPPLHGVVCNAGIQVVRGVRRSADGHELTFATNHLGHFLLVRLLTEYIAEPGRIVLVSSATHFGPPRSLGFPGPRWNDARVLADPDAAGPDDSPKAGRIRYSTSKLANIYTAYELARRLSDRDVTVNAFDPGLMPETRLDRDYAPMLQRMYDRITPVLVHAPGARSVRESAADLAWLMTAPEPAATTGAYFVGRRRRRSSGQSYDTARATELWAASDELAAAHTTAGS